MSTFMKYIACILIMAVLSSCNSKETLQTYFVDHQETPNFTTVDIPTTFVNFDDVNLTPEQEEAYKSVERLNFLGYKISENNLDTYNQEKQKVKNILNDEKYVELMEFSLNGGSVSIKSLGEENVDEFVVFGSSTQQGFGVVRILGNDMSPEKMMALFQAIQSANIDDEQLKSVLDFFK
ncbi:DUF4252 domain-containing protein [Corallibacter sp.]|uniref:DUF4252 domain-containing protein n=1 Tax=Corallibacter sp. TaxID=2038084 RepID=UPI003AB8DA84